MPTAPMLWAEVLTLIREDGKRYALTWLERMQALDVKEDALVLGVPDRFFRDWVDDHYRALLEEALQRLPGGLKKVSYEVVEGGPVAAAPLAGEPTAKS